MNLNELAIELLEKNEYEESLKLFKKAVQVARNVQSLNNLAWIYIYEEQDTETAFELMKEVIEMKPSSHFSYNLLGEIYIKKKMWGDASSILLQSITIQPSMEAYKNLGIANYYLRELKEASEYLLMGASNSDYYMYGHIKCLIEMGNTTEAKRKLDLFSEEDENFIGEIEVAELYIEMGCFKEAIVWFEKGRKVYSDEPRWISRYVYCLLKVSSLTSAQEIIGKVIEQTNELIQDVLDEECDKGWTESDKEERVSELISNKEEYNHVIEKIMSGYVPQIEFEIPIATDCYLFGCQRHKHPGYEG
ncbi:tetratricopeptide repeat protein [Bacillus sp. TL12]|uniref:tetratricopeptide repeat protein n=1 Tax=Bacillus sp. TL12 TaxID=2894756 RepID=UPI001F526611|nr:tetratricopeptide repeat protein [Bacillus sp. TL12]